MLANYSDILDVIVCWFGCILRRNSFIHKYVFAGVGWWNEYDSQQVRTENLWLALLGGCVVDLCILVWQWRYIIVVQLAVLLARSMITHRSVVTFLSIELCDVSWKVNFVLIGTHRNCIVHWTSAFIEHYNDDDDEGWKNVFGYAKLNHWL
jgi:hypothetical protein